MSLVVVVLHCLLFFQLEYSHYMITWKNPHTLMSGFMIPLIVIGTLAFGAPSHQHRSLDFGCMHTTIPLELFKQITLIVTQEVY